MKKAFFLSMIIAILAAAGLSAQTAWEGNRRMAVMINPIPLVLGTAIGGFGLEAGFEYAPAPQFSVKTGVYYMGYFYNLYDYTTANGGNSSTGMYTMRVSLEGRWYPNEDSVHGLFLNGGFQYHRLGGSYSITVYDYGGQETSTGQSQGYNTYCIYLGVGYKAIFGKNRAGFAMEPTLDFVGPLYSEIPFGGDLASNNLAGWVLGIKMFRLGIAFGAAF